MADGKRRKTLIESNRPARDVTVPDVPMTGSVAAAVLTPPVGTIIAKAQSVKTKPSMQDNPPVALKSQCKSRAEAASSSGDVNMAKASGYGTNKRRHRYSAEATTQA